MVYAPGIVEKSAQQLAAYKCMPDDVLFRIQRVNITLNDYDMPGPTRRKVVCSRCGQLVRDHREVMVDDKPVCRPCTEDVYFSDPNEISLGYIDLALENDQFRQSSCVLGNPL